MLLKLVVLAGVVGGGSRPAVAVPPATRPVSAPASRPAALDPAVEKILDRLENKIVKDLQADLVYLKIDPILEDEQKFKGFLRFLEGRPNPRFFIRFDEVVHEGIVRKKKEWHVFDGEWYIEAREKTETTVMRQIARPGEEVDAFKVGKGPFPLPFGQKKQDILRHFEVKLVPPSPKDPQQAKNADHLACTPLPGTELDKKYGKVHFYIDGKLDLPVYVKTVEKEEGNEIAAGFSNIRLNQKLDPATLTLPPDLRYPVKREYLPPPEKPRTKGGEKER